MKVCKSCNQQKDIEEFYRSTVYKDGRVPKCKDCVREYDKTLIAKDRAIPATKVCCKCKQEKPKDGFHKRPRNSDGLRSECIECTRGQEKDYRTRKPDKDYLRKIRQKYKISEDDFISLLNKHNSQCAICQETRKLVIDHCHNSGKIRGLLCANCNAGLGMFGDKLEYLGKAIKYLQESS